MRRHRTPSILLLLPLLFVAPLFAGDGEDTEPPKDETKVVYTFGYQGSSTTGDLFRVAEYDVVKPTAYGGLSWTNSPYDVDRIGFELLRTTSYDSMGAIELDMDRKLRLRTSFDGLIHRLDNDPLDNMQAASDIKTVRRSDLDLGSDHQMRVRLFDTLVETQQPGVRELTYRLGYKQVERSGHRQSLNTSHCMSCHVTAQGQEVDQKTSTFTGGLHFARGLFDLDYELNSRQFRDDAAVVQAPYEAQVRPAPAGWTPSPTNLQGQFNPANQPASTPNPFNDRLWFQAGDFATGVIPDFRHLENIIKLRFAIRPESAFRVTGVYSGNENVRTGRESSFGALRASYFARFGQDLRFSAFAHHEEIENDSAQIDLASLFGGAPTQGYGSPPVAMTYQGWRRGDTDDEPPGLALLNQTVEFENYLAESAMDRTQDRLGADLVWRPVRRGSFRFGYTYGRIDRDKPLYKWGFTNGDLERFQLDRETTSNAFRFSWNQRLRSRVRFHVDARYTLTDNPYSNVNGGLRRFAGFRMSDGEPLGQTPVPPGPRGTASLQYYELHTFRIADMTNKPTDDLKVRARVRWGPKGSRWSIGANARYKDRQNDELDYAKWDQDGWGAGVNYWVTATSKLLLNFGYDHTVQTTRGDAYIPLMDG